MLSQSESGLSHSQPLRLTPNESRPGSGKRTEDFCPLAYLEIFLKRRNYRYARVGTESYCENLTTCLQLIIGERIGNKDREVYG
jgi:hypothetical protein